MKIRGKRGGGYGNEACIVHKSCVLLFNPFLIGTVTDDRNGHRDRQTISLG